MIIFLITFRLFSCGTSKDGVSYLVEWDDTEGRLKRTYSGTHSGNGNKSTGVVQFDITRKYLAVGEDNRVKFWDMDDSNILATVDAGGGLPVSFCLSYTVLLTNSKSPTPSTSSYLYLEKVR